MKIDCHSPTQPPHRPRGGGAAPCRVVGWVSLAVVALLALLGQQQLGARAAEQPPGNQSPATASPKADGPERAKPAADPQLSQLSQPKAVALLRRVIQQLAHGPAFDAKVRERVWTSGREVVGVGTYEQAGEGTGRYNLQVTMHDGAGKHSLQQISDGRLAWTRTQIGEEISLRRVDVGRLDEWIEPSERADLTAATDGSDPGISPRLKVGGWTELLAQVEHDYVLQLSSGSLQSPGAGGNGETSRPVWIVSGRLREEVRAERLKRSGREQWPPLCPNRVRIAIAAAHTDATGFGKGLPVYLEFWSDQGASDEATGPADSNSTGRRHLISLIELYSIRPISPPPVGRFRFDNQDVEVNFVNETERYLKQYGLRMTRRQQRELLR